MAIKIDRPVQGAKPPALDQGALWGKPSKSAQPWHPPMAVPTAPKAPVKKSGGGGGGGGIRRSGGGGYGGGGGGGGLSVQSATPSEADYLSGDATYQATMAALAKQLQNFNTDIDSQLSNRKIDYSNALRDLGYVAPAADGGESGWNYDDTLTAAGRAYQSMLNDFASRGMLQSQGYADAQNDLSRTLNQQYEGMKTSNDQFINDMTRQKTKASDENNSATAAARAEAIMRRAAQYGFGV